MKNKKKLFDYLLWSSLLIPQIIILNLNGFKKIYKGDSFYAETINLFYLRVLDLVNGNSL